MLNKLLVSLTYFFVLSPQNVVFSLAEFGNFDAFVDMVVRNISASLTYSIPKNNFDLLKLKHLSIKDFGTYDFIIVGAGSAGAVIANRLSEISDWKILLLEAGREYNDFTKIMGFNSYTFNSDFNWGYNTTVQSNACLAQEGQRCALAQGKVAGGGSTINGGIYSRGDPEDYDRWANLYGNFGWSYEDVLPYFIKSENAAFYPRDIDYHGVDGYFTVDRTTETPGLEPAFIKGFKELGLPFIDYNGRFQNGISKVQFALLGNERVNSASAFLDHFLYRRNLKVSLNSFVTTLLINEGNNVAYGVQFVKDGQTYVAKASKEVIVTAGAINSAQLLMLSGIGPREHLQNLGIPVKKDLPVGQHFQDHVMFMGFFFRTRKQLYNYTLVEQLRRYVRHQRPLTAGVFTEMLGFTNFPQDKNKRSEIEYMISSPAFITESFMIDYGYQGLNRQYPSAYTINPATDISVLVILLHPKSKGTVTLKSSSPLDKPIINPNYFAVEEDIEKVYQGIEFLLALNNTQAFREYGAEVIVLDYPNCENFEKLTKDYWICAIRQLSSTLYHPASTIRMGPDSRFSVVDPTLKVHGIERLRVADSSIIPELISGHLMAPVIMIGEKAADIIKAEYYRLN